MLIQGTAITVTYKKIRDIKKVYYNNEKVLKDFFNVATVLPIPDDAPDEIPRIIIKTLNEHAQLNISPIATTFEVHYDDKFQRDWNECANYLTERMSKVFEFLNILTGNLYEYVGLISNILYDEVIENGTKKIVNSLLNSNKIKDIYDINIKYTFVENEKFFINIMLQNARIFKNDNIISSTESLCQNKQVAESIGVIVDINDRYGFNIDKNYKSSCDVLNKLIQSMGNVINNKIKKLIEEGAY